MPSFSPEENGNQVEIEYKISELENPIKSSPDKEAKEGFNFVPYGDKYIGLYWRQSF